MDAKQSGTCICDKCRCTFEPVMKEVKCEQDGKELIGRPVWVRAFMCPNCGEVYIVSVMDNKMLKQTKRAITEKEKRKLRRKEKELRDRYIERLHSRNV